MAGRENSGEAKGTAVSSQPEAAGILSRLLPSARHEETHLSHVFITGNDVYKLKKPVRLPFCDYSTVERRHEACQTEVEINQPLAASLYKGVIPLTGRDGDYAIGGDGPVIDWLVHMAPFEESDRADIALDRDHISATGLRDFTTRLFLSHEGTAHPCENGWPQRVREITDNLVESLRDSALPDDQQEAVTDWQKKLHDRIAAEHDHLEERGSGAILATCHGDLHLKNLCLWQGELIAYDALEFDESLVRIDGLYDIAFLIADLWHHGHEAHANMVMNRYLGLSDDYESVRLIPIYCSLRAGVRAMAAAMSGAEDEASSYLRTAEDFLEPVGKTKVHLISGRSGTGKTSVAEALAPTLPPPPGALHIRSDVLRKRRYGQLPEAPLPEEAYSPDESRAVYEACIDAAGQLAGQWPVILDIALAGKDEASLPDLGQLDLRKIWLTAPDDVLHTRISARKNDASDATTAVMQSQRTAPPGDGWSMIDASGPIGETVRRIREL